MDSRIFRINKIYTFSESLEEEITELKNAVKLFFAPVEILLRILNKDVMPHLIELMKFANGKKLDEETVNIDFVALHEKVYLKQLYY